MPALISEAVTRTGIVCIFCCAENKCSHQFLNWWQPHATGMGRSDLSIPVRAKKEDILKDVLFPLGVCISVRSPTGRSRKYMESPTP